MGRWHLSDTRRRIGPDPDALPVPEEDEVDDDRSLPVSAVGVAGADIEALVVGVRHFEPADTGSTIEAGFRSS